MGRNKHAWRKEKVKKHDLTILEKKQKEIMTAGLQFRSFGPSH